LNKYLFYIKPLNSAIKKIDQMITQGPMAKIKQKGIILLVDNRDDREVGSKAKLVDFRNSAFKCKTIDNDAET
jgi:hypothetical protein